jgi:hypothetical protein
VGGVPSCDTMNAGALGVAAAVDGGERTKHERHGH